MLEKGHFLALSDSPDNASVAVLVARKEYDEKKGYEIFSFFVFFFSNF